MKYVLYEGENGDMLFTKQELITPSVIKPFENKTPTWTCDANDDSNAITLLNAHMMAKSVKQ